ncbi:heparan-alpha-glucosaminide N-acetyltransferase domain-containing protein [Shewanella sp. C32]|uniref:Heparan-alpha-glucosaminide N-acetyltransferase domain-containing protein n=1 Tax=Shewanella electrica TaxID=515560 RepID=A0ABT2FHG6_9GAMM|nr:heparan-alpha-glucosaminide N-acetyltransferase domain-containing protein [Shewanella electrica]MCH1923602.1 heparan-alpha-glucosaminide N-acetyltransferase domain-containing protein [Shewanella electrica]MCS4555698.1 heparan-alpha-glucosaminide N-acetyltransferase domain-containing protein [Shewanella electrica]
MASDIKQRINSIDMMRGLVMLIMVLDHVRERFFLHQQVSDPMDINTTPPALYFSRLAAHLCAPTFVFLTGLSAWLYQHSGPSGHRPLTGFLVKRGLFLILLEVTLITFSWMGSYHTLYLQVMWAIGLSMLALAALQQLPRWSLFIIASLLVFGHNALTPIQFAPSEWGYSAWTILHDRGYLLSDSVINVKVSYPLLPWIGVIVFGYLAGPLYNKATDAALRQRWLWRLGWGCLALFAILRGANIYGETLPWHSGETVLASAMSLFNLTKYPPSLAFLLLTLGVMFIGLVLMERLNSRFAQRAAAVLAQFGGAPMFFYLLHLYLLLLLYQIAMAIWGANYGELFGVNSIEQIWLISLGLILLLYWPTKQFAAFKRRTTLKWVKYL